MSFIIVTTVLGWLFVDSFDGVLAIGVVLGIAGAGNSGTVLALLLAPPLARAYGWHAVYGFAALFMAVPLIVMILIAREPPDQEHQTLREHVQCLWEADGWAFNLVYVITFGGFIGLSTFLPSFFYAQFGVSKVAAGQLTVLAALMGSAIRIVGGWVSDRIGGIVTLSVVLVAAIGVFLSLTAEPSLVVTTGLFMLCFALLGMGNGALFQLVPLRWPNNTAVASSMIGEIGALGGAILPNVMGFSKQWTGGFGPGFLIYALFTAAVLVGLRLFQRRWTRTWVGPGGRVRARAEPVAAG